MPQGVQDKPFPDVDTKAEAFVLFEPTQDVFCGKKTVAGGR